MRAAHEPEAEGDRETHTHTHTHTERETHTQRAVKAAAGHPTVLSRAARGQGQGQGQGAYKGQHGNHQAAAGHRKSKVITKGSVVTMAPQRTDSVSVKVGLLWTVTKGRELRGWCGPCLLGQGRVNKDGL